MTADKRHARWLFTTDDLEPFDVGTRAHSHDDSIDLDRAIAMLPKAARNVFVLTEVEGYKQSEVAELSGIAEGTVKAQLHRARKLLQAALNR